jgi:putative PIN family toxin of toxin-antitoxin system
MRCVLDTNVVIAAMRSPRGASALLLMKAREGKIVMLANVALALEYEATCGRPEHMAAAGLSAHEVEIFVTAVVGMIAPVESHFMWRPQLRDPGDELVLEAAVNGMAVAIVTFNRRDFGAVPARFGIEVLTPLEVIRRIT